MDIGTISVVVLMGMLVLLAIGMPLGFASGFLAVVVMAMKFGRELLFSSFGTAPLNSLSQRIYGITTSYMLVSVPLFSFMANVLERSGIARDMYDTLEKWMNLTRGGIAVLTALMAVVIAAMSGIIGGKVVLLGVIELPQMLHLGCDQNLAIGTICASGLLGITGISEAAGIGVMAVLVWFGILFCVNMQVSFLSPPFGAAAFYLKSVTPPHITPPAIFRSFLPFIGIQIMFLMLILLVPQITMLFL